MCIILTSSSATSFLTFTKQSCEVGIAFKLLDARFVALKREAQAYHFKNILLPVGALQSYCKTR